MHHRQRGGVACCLQNESLATCPWKYCDPTIAKTALWCQTHNDGWKAHLFIPFPFTSLHAAQSESGC